jgi:hypothetical protein
VISTRFALLPLTFGLALLVSCGPRASAVGDSGVDDVDAGELAPVEDAGAQLDAGTPGDAGSDAGAHLDAGAGDGDAGSGPTDAGGSAFDAGFDAGVIDAGPPPCTTNALCGGGANVCGSNGVCLVDVTPPTLTFLSPASGTAISGATVTVTGTATDSQSGLASVSLSTDGTTFNAVPVVGGQFSAVLQVPAVQASSFLVTAHATDTGGLTTVATLPLTADRVGPSIVVASPAADGSCTASACTGALVNVATGASYAISGSVVDPSGVGTASLRILDGAAVVVPTTSLTLGAGGSWSYSWSPLPSVNGRAYVVEVSASDSLGNAASPVTRTIIVDRVPPTLTITSPVSGALVSGASVTLVGVAGDGTSYGISAVSTSLDGTTWTPATFAADGSFSAALPVPGVDHVSQTLSVQVVDLAGNSKLFTTSYVADRVAPVVAFSAPAADYSCPSATAACTGAVANAATSSVPFSGTLTEGGGVSSVTLSAQVVDPVTSTTLQTSTPAAASPWSATWTGLPTGINGHEYHLVVTATDAAGNKSAPIIRKVWLDNVAPTATAMQSGSRLIGLQSSLVSFSEPMTDATTLAAMAFTPAVTAPSTLAADVTGKVYGFSGNELGYYAPYTLAVSVGATDHAGNPLAAAVSEKFLTAVKPLTFPYQVLGATVTASPLLPRLVVDDDGRAALTTTYGAAAPLLIQVRGDGVPTTSTVAVDSTGQNWLPTDLRITTNGLKADLTRSWGLRLPVTFKNVFNGQSLDYVSRSDTGAWLNAAGGAGYELLNDISPQSMPVFEIDPPTSLSGEVLRVLSVSPANAVTNNEFSGSWGVATVGNVTGFQQQQGAATLDLVSTTRSVRYWDHRGTSLVASGTNPNDLLVPVGQPQRMTIDKFGLPSAQTPAFVAWGTTSGIGSNAQTSLTIACSQTPTGIVPGWLASSKSVASGTAATAPTRIATALNTLQFAAAIDLGTSVVVVSAPSSSPCSSLPVLTVVGAVANAKQPALAVDSTGKVWLAYVDVISKALMLTRF